MRQNSAEFYAGLSKMCAEKEFRNLQYINAKRGEPESVPFLCCNEHDCHGDHDHCDRANRVKLG